MKRLSFRIKKMKKENQKNSLTVNVRFIISGVVNVHAENLVQARQIVREGFGLSCGEPHASDTRISDWDIDMCPDKEVF